MIKVIHTADIHLDSPLSMLDLQKAEIRRQEIMRSFSELMAYAKRENADFLLISGDLFDTSHICRETVDMLRHEFAQLSPCKVIIAPGNHDPYTDTSIYKRVRFSENVYVFDTSAMSRFDFPEQNTSVYGYAFTSQHMELSPICNAKPCDADRINLLVAHGDTLSPISKYCPITNTDLEGLEFDYTALGHIHASDGIRQNKKGKFYGYSGCLEGRGFDETGLKGAYLVTIEKAEGELELKHEFLPFSKRIYENIRLDITGAESQTQVVERVKELISQAGCGERHALKITLDGFVDPMLRIFPSYITERVTGLFMLSIEDETMPTYDSDGLENDKTIKGAFYRKLKPMLESDDPVNRKAAALALRYGIIALSGGEPAEIQ